MCGVWILLGIFLVVGSVYDLKTMNLPQWLLIMGLIAGVAGGVYINYVTGKGCIGFGLGLLPGIVILILACVTREQIGQGDGLIMLIIGSLLGLECSLIILWIGLMGSCVAGIGLLLIRRGNRKTRMPFIPFLLIGLLLAGGGLYL